VGDAASSSSSSSAPAEPSWGNSGNKAATKRKAKRAAGSAAAARWSQQPETAEAQAQYVAAAAALDRAMYGRWVFVPWRFVSFNLLTSGAAAYGTHAWHWYATAGLPAAVGLLTPLAWAGAALAEPGRRALAGAAAACMGALGVSQHKEFRFLLPLLPIAAAYAGAVLVAMHDGVSPLGLRCGADARTVLLLFLDGTTFAQADPAPGRFGQAGHTRAVWRHRGAARPRGALPVAGAPVGPRPCNGVPRC
jgi:hypothetical protein